MMPKTKKNHKITEFDRPTIKRLRSEIDDALLELSEKYGIEIKTGSASFSNTNVTFKLELATVGSDGEVNTKEMDDFRHNAWRFGLSEDDLGKEFTHRGNRYRVVGMKPRSPKYPIIAERIGDGARFKFPSGVLK